MIAEGRDNAGIGIYLEVADGHSLVDANGKLAFALEFLELAEIIRLAVGPQDCRRCSARW